MTLEEIETIMIDNLKTDKAHFGRTKLFGFENASKLILASHLRSKIKLVKLMTEYLRCNGDKNAILHYKAILKEFNDKLNQ